MEKDGETNEITSNILDIPRELLNAIVVLLSKEEDRSNVRLVSRLFFDLVGRSQFNIGLILPSEVEQLVQVFGRYKKPLGLTFGKIQKLGTDDTKRLLSLTQLTSLDINGDVDSSTLIQLSQLVSLSIKMNPLVTTSTLQHLSKLTYLQAKVIGDATETVTLTNLISLDWTNTEDSWPNLACHKVTSLTLRFRTSPPPKWLAQFKPNTMVLQNLSKSSSLYYHLPSGSCQNLTSLSITGIMLRDKSEVPWHQLKELSLNFSMKTMDMSALMHVSKCTSLTTLVVNSATNQDMVDAIFVQELKHLQSFTMLIGGTPPFGSVKNLLPQFNKDSLKSLCLTVYQDHEECFAEISKMTALESLYLYIRHTTLDYEPVDLSSLMTMTHLKSLALHPSRYIGLDNLSRMTNLNTIKIASESPDDPVKKFTLAAFTDLMDLELTKCVSTVDLCGANRLTRFVYDAPNKTTGAIELIAEELVNLKEISIGSLSTPIPWTNIAKFTALECLVTDTFAIDESISTLQNLRRLTRLSNKTLFTNSYCAHFDPNHLAYLTQLQRIEIVVPKNGITATIVPKLHRVLTLEEHLCLKCVKQAKADELKAMMLKKQQQKKDKSSSNK